MRPFAYLTAALAALTARLEGDDPERGDVPGWVMITLGSMLAFGMGWGWSGLSILAIVRASPRDAGAATGFTQAGVFAGAVFGPLAFGWIVQQGSYAPAWFTMAGIAMAAAFLAIWSDRLIGRPHAALAGAGPA